jgi:superfamily II DNA or RNA helicase
MNGTEEGAVMGGGAATTAVAAVVSAAAARLRCQLHRFDLAEAERESPKILIFSTWNEVLELLSRVLTGKAIPHRRLAGRSLKAVRAAVDSFRTDPAVAALLLPFASGSNGLNLTEASHVFLVEPTFNPAVEAQAVGRVHRIGQTAAETVVHRFVVDDSVEVGIMALRGLNQNGGEAGPRQPAGGSAADQGEVAPPVGAACQKDDFSLADVEALFALPAQRVE